MAIPFMKDEAEGTRLIAFWACVAITFGLALVSLFGVWAEDGEAVTFWIFVGKIFWSIAIVGAEFLVAMALQRALIAPSKARKVGGVIVFCMLAYFCVGNVERGVHAMYPTVFKSDTQQLKDLAALAGTQSADIKSAAGTAIGDIPTQLANVRGEIAKLEAEQKLIAGDGTEAGIKRSQRHLQSITYYEGEIDGLWEQETKDAALRRGNEIKADLEVKKALVTQLESGQSVTTTAVASNTQDTKKIEIEAAARKREAFGSQVLLGAWTLEGARSLGWIVFLSLLTVGAVSSTLRRQEELDELEHQQRLAALRANADPAPPAPPPVAVEPPPPPIPPQEPEPEPAATPEPEPLVLVDPVPEPVAAPELPPVNQGSRKGGKNASLMKAAAKAARNRVLILADRSDAQVMKVAAE